MEATCSLDQSYIYLPPRDCACAHAVRGERGQVAKGGRLKIYFFPVHPTCVHLLARPSLPGVAVFGGNRPARPASLAPIHAYFVFYDNSFLRMGGVGYKNSKNRYCSTMPMCSDRWDDVGPPSIRGLHTTFQMVLVTGKGSLWQTPLCARVSWAGLADTWFCVFDTRRNVKTQL